MHGVNQVVLVGNLGRNPMLRFTRSGLAVCHLSVATTGLVCDEDGVESMRTEWHTVVVAGEAAREAAKELRRSCLVLLEGRLVTQVHTNQRGARRERTEVVAHQVRRLSHPRSTHAQESLGLGAA